LRSADGASERALDHDQRAFAERSGEFLEELVGVGGGELLELRRADLRINPFLGLAAPGGQRVFVALDRVEPVLDALLDGVRGRRADAGVYLFVRLIERVLDFGLGPSAHRAADALTVFEAERDRAHVALVDLVPVNAVVAVVAVALLRLCRLGGVVHRASAPFGG